MIWLETRSYRTLAQAPWQLNQRPAVFSMPCGERNEAFYVSSDSMLMSVSLRLETGSLEPSTPHALFPLQVIDTDVSPYDVARDGQHFLVLETAEHTAQPLTVIVNWPTLLSKANNSQ